MPKAMLARDPAAADHQVVDEERQRDLVQLVGDELVGEPAGEVHQVVGGDRAGDGDLHGEPSGVGTARAAQRTGSVPATPAADRRRTAGPRRRRGRPPRTAAAARSGDSVERVAAGAGAGGVGVVDREALLLDAVDEVDRRAVEVGDAHPVDDDARRRRSR